ncbi:hypothetical protein T459_32811 [Capsicum annuum]|uniref:Disease resistance RPP13-like protein 1 n=1 Tax=Capsicum annuum TaxID=4072 RepID=A0A2G2Y0T1_CAPAN|nr:putative disease resistance RPP13-like protein 1-like [Capsicum annuum]PHT63348.1 hypothetical protein T459_32811 [Capsicum annuum]
MEMGLAAGGAFLSSALGVLFDRLAPDLLEMFQKNKHDVRLLKKLKMTLVDIQAVLCDAENKQASNQHVSQWLNELRDAVDGAENLMEQVNYEALRLKNNKGLLQEIGSFDLKDDDNINRLQVKLKEKLNGKRFLIVLDDMWNDNYKEWDDLRNIFVQGDIGSKIIVTTRKESVALMMGSGAINVGTLSDEASWALFRRHSLENRDPMEHPELEEVGKNCSQVQRTALSSEDALWLVTLRIRDHPFRKEQVIHLWIANGLVVPRGDERIQDLGNQFFLELRSRSLFELVPDPFQGNTEEFLILDLVNDLAQIASSKLCVRLEECQGSHMLEQSQH